MLRLRWSVGALAVLFAFGLGRAADDDTFDLRGPAPQKGQEFVSKGTLKIKNADTTMKRAGETVAVKLTLLVTLEEEMTVLEVTGREVTKCRTKILKDRVETSGADKDAAHIETSVLEKEMVVSTRDGKKWKHALVDIKPTEKQTKELDDRNGIESDDDLYPKEKVKVGHAWTVDAGAFNKVLGNAFSEMKGKLAQKFVKVEEIDGEKAAVVESSGKVTGKMKGNGDSVLNAEVELKHTTWKSLKTGVAVREQFEGKITVTGTVKEDNINTELTLSGPISGETTTKLVEKK